LDSLCDDRLRDAGKLAEGVPRISCKRVAAVAENHKGQKSREVSHHWTLHDQAGCNLLNSNPTFSTLATSFLFEAVQDFFLKRCFDAWNSTISKLISSALHRESDLRGLVARAGSAKRFVRP
jgi:hypothetical protein